MAIAHDADSASIVRTTETSYGWSHTVTGSNPVLVASFATRPNTSNVTAVTYAGAALTKIRSDTNGNRVSAIWYLLAPTVGTATITDFITGSPTHSDGRGTSLTGVLALDANTGNNNAGSANPSVAITTVAANSWIVDSLDTGLDDGVATPTSPQTLTSKIANTGAHTGAQSYQGPVVTPAATGQSYTVTSSNWAFSVASFSPVLSGAVISFPFMTTNTKFFGA